MTIGLQRDDGGEGEDEEEEEKTTVRSVPDGSDKNEKTDVRAAKVIPALLPYKTDPALDLAEDHKLGCFSRSISTWLS